MENKTVKSIKSLLLLVFFQTEKLIFHLIDDFHVIKVPTTPNKKPLQQSKWHQVYWTFSLP